MRADQTLDEARIVRDQLARFERGGDGQAAMGFGFVRHEKLSQEGLAGELAALIWGCGAKWLSRPDKLLWQEAIKVAQPDFARHLFGFFQLVVWHV